MAQFTRTNGDFLPLVNYDSFSYTNSGVNAITSAATVQPAGPKLDFFTITFAGTGTTGTQIQNTFQAIEQLATVMMYEFTTASDDTLAIAIYPVGAWTTGTLDTAVTAAAAEAVTVAASATFTG